MRDRAQREVGKVLIYGMALVAVGAVISPWVYNACMAVAEVTVNKRTNGLVDRLGAIFRQADFGRFFEWGMAAAAVLLFFPFVEWLRVGRGEIRYRDTPWSLVRLDERADLATGQPLRRNRRGIVDFMKGLMVMASGMIVMAFALLQTKTFVVREGQWPFSEMPWKMFGVALGLAFAREWALRGVVMGIFLRAMTPRAAVCWMAVVFAGFHSLRPPPEVTVVDPEAAWVGLEVLRKLVGRLADPRVWVTEVAPLLVLGGLLAHARLRTASLWMPVGLHTAWSGMMALFHQWLLPVPQTSALVRTLVGDSLHRGLIPLGGLILVWLLVYFLTPPDVASSPRST